MKKLLLFVLVLVFTACSGNLDGYAWNDLPPVEQGGVQIQVARLAVYKIDSLPKDEQKTVKSMAMYANKNTKCDLYLKITNNTNRTMSVYADQGLLLANKEQVQLLSAALLGTGTLGGQILPGVTVSGEISFGLKDVTPDTIQSMMIKISAPHDDFFQTYGQDYVINLDLSKHEWVDKPKDLE